MRYIIKGLYKGKDKDYYMNITDRGTMFIWHNGAWRYAQKNLTRPDGPGISMRLDELKYKYPTHPFVFIPVKQIIPMGGGVWGFNRVGGHGKRETPVGIQREDYIFKELQTYITTHKLSYVLERMDGWKRRDRRGDIILHHNNKPFIAVDVKSLNKLSNNGYAICNDRKTPLEWSIDMVGKNYIPFYCLICPKDNKYWFIELCCFTMWAYLFKKRPVIHPVLPKHFRTLDHIFLDMDSFFKIIQTYIYD